MSWRGEEGGRIEVSGNVRKGLVSPVFTWDVDRKSGSAHLIIFGY